MLIAFIVLFGLSGCAFLWKLVLVPLFSEAYGSGKKCMVAIGGISCVLGGLGFFASALSASGKLQGLPASFEWPMGSAQGVVTTRDGLHVVPHPSSGRIQLYDQDWKFIRGWYVDARGGLFALRLTEADQIEAMTARGQMRHLYGMDGVLISKENAPNRHFNAPNKAGVAVTEVPTPWWLLMFSNPFYSWIFAAAGFAVLTLMERARLRNAQPACRARQI